MTFQLIIFQLIVIIFSAAIHEYMHGWMADRLGDPTARMAGRLTLNPLAHIDLWGSVIMPALIFFGTRGSFIFGYAKPVPFNPYNLKDQKYGVAKVAIAGPMANLVIALFFGLILRFFPLPNVMLGMLFVKIVQINLVLMILNLTPIPPLDGSKVLMPFLPHEAQMKYASLERYGMFLVLMFVFFGFSLIIPLINFLFRLIVGV